MSKKFIKPILLVVTASTLMVLSACEINLRNSPSTASSIAPAEQVSYKVQWAYSTEDEKAPMDWAIAELKKAMPNVTIEVEPQANDNGESLKARIATGDLPDIFGIQPNMIDAAKNSKSIIELDHAVAASGFADKLLPSAKDQQLIYSDGHIYGLPIAGTSVDLLFYNKALFAENGIKVPANYPELLADVKAFHARSIISIPIFAKEAWPIGAFFDMFADRVTPEGMLALNNGTAKASDEGFKSAITKMAELVKAGVFQKGATSTDYEAARSIFHKGKAAMLVNGEWDIAEIVAELGDKADFFDVFPTTDAGEEDTNQYAMPGASELGGLAVSSKVKDPVQAGAVAVKLAELIGQGSYIKLGRIDMAIKLDGLTPEKPLSAMATKLLAAKAKYTIKGTVSHSLPNKAFATGFGELLQKLAVGQSADAFIKETNALFESTK